MIFPETELDISYYGLESLLGDELSDELLVDVLKGVCERYTEKMAADAQREEAEHETAHGFGCRCLGPMAILRMRMRNGCPMERYAHELLLANGRANALKMMLGQNPPNFYERVKPELIAKYDCDTIAAYVYSDNYLMQFDRRESALEKFYKMCVSTGANKCRDALKKSFRTLTSRYDRQIAAGSA